MMEEIMPRYPVFIPSKGRAEGVLTAKCFSTDGVPFKLVVEPQEAESYAKVWGEDKLLILPENNQGLVYSRNWIKSYSIERGDARHWQFDDDIRSCGRLYRGFRMYCSARLALAIVEDFVERYENVGLASLNDQKFLVATKGTQLDSYPPFYLNHRCYTCFLVLNALPYKYRYRYNEDTDMTLQVLAGGWCTMLFNTFNMVSPATLTRSGGQMASTAASYLGDGRLKMARQLERVWPGVVKTTRRFGRPQHVVNWRKFTTPLKPVVPAPPIRDYGLSLKVTDEIKSEDLRRVVDDLAWLGGQS